MAKLDKEDLLAAWQVLWGQLEPRWHQPFMNDPSVQQIIWYDSEFIYPSLKRFSKLAEVLDDIKRNTLIINASEDLETTTEFLEHQAERDALLEIRKNIAPPIPKKPNPSEMKPLEPVEITMEDLRRQPGDRPWWGGI